MTEVFPRRAIFLDAEGAASYPSGMSTLESLLRTQGMRQRQLAERLNISEANISRWATGKADIPVRYLQPIAEAIGVPVGDVLAVALKKEGAPL